MTIAAEIQRVTPALLYWQAYEPAVKCDLSSVAVATADGLILIDPIALAEPSDLPAEPAAILLTNANHARSAMWWRERSGARIHAPSIALDGLEIVPDRVLEEGDIAPGGFTVISIHGGAPGETAYVGNGIACLGDALTHLDSHGFDLLPPKYCTDAQMLPRSLRKLLSCDFDILTFAHGRPLTHQPRERLAELLA